MKNFKFASIAMLALALTQTALASSVIEPSDPRDPFFIKKDFQGSMVGLRLCSINFPGECTQIGPKSYYTASEIHNDRVAAYLKMSGAGVLDAAAVAAAGTAGVGVAAGGSILLGGIFGGGLLTGTAAAAVSANMGISMAVLGVGSAGAAATGISRTKVINPVAYFRDARLLRMAISDKNEKSDDVLKSADQLSNLLGGSEPVSAPRQKIAASSAR